MSSVRKPSVCCTHVTHYSIFSGRHKLNLVTFNCNNVITTSWGDREILFYIPSVCVWGGGAITKVLHSELVWASDFTSSYVSRPFSCPRYFSQPNVSHSRWNGSIFTFPSLFYASFSSFLFLRPIPSLIFFISLCCFQNCCPNITADLENRSQTRLFFVYISYCWLFLSPFPFL